MALEPFLLRLLIAALILWLVEKLLNVVTLSAQVREILIILLIIIVVLWAIFGFIPA